MKVIRFIHILSIFLFGTLGCFTQTKSNFVGTWDVVSTSTDGTIHLKKRFGFSNKNYSKNRFFKFDTSGNFIRGPISIRHCGYNIEETYYRIKRIWEWHNYSKELVISQKSSYSKMETKYKVLKVTNHKLILKHLKTI